MLSSLIGVSIVGEDPETTSISWDGETGGTMLRLNGIAYSRFVRLTFDGRRRAAIAVDQSWDGLRAHFDTGNEYSDDRFVDVDYGIHGGFNGHGFAETSIRRSLFTRNMKAGVALGNFNALNIWIWQSTFEDCGEGVTNRGGAGNYHVYASLFRRSKLADLGIGNTGEFSARGNYSIGSKTFFTGDRLSNPALIDIQNNIVIDSIDPSPIAHGNQGPALITDNVIVSRPGAVGPAIRWETAIDADVTSVGNTFTVPSPIQSNGRLITLDDRVVDRADINLREEPVAAGPLPSLHRRVFEVPAGSDVIGIQRILEAAALRNGTRPIVHLPSGLYSIAETLTIPASDIQLVGDGYGTILQWTGIGTGPVLRLLGPSKATLREIKVSGSLQANAIVVESVDQLGSRVYMGQVELRGGAETNLFVDGLDNTFVQLEDGAANYTKATSIKVTGGPLLAAGHASPGRMSVFSGGAGGNRMSFDVSSGARVLVRDFWYEADDLRGFASIHGRATVTLDGIRIATGPNGTQPAVDIRDLNGRVAVLSAEFNDRVVVSGDGARSLVLALGVFARHSTPGYFSDVSSPQGQGALVNSRQFSDRPTSRSAAAPNSGSVGDSFIGTMLSHARAETWVPLSALPSTASDVRMFRVWVTDGLNNITLTGR